VFVRPLFLMIMNRIAVLTITLLAAGADAETLTLRNGIVVSGKLQSMDAQDVGIERCGRVEHFAREEVKSINLESASRGEACSASSQPKLELPAGLSITLRILDYIDSQREQTGQVFRAELESSIKVDGRVLVSSGAKAIVKLVPTGDPTSDRTLDLVSFQVGTRWARIEARPAEGASIMSTPPALTTASVSDDSPDFRLNKIVLRAERILAPTNTRLTFVFKVAAALRYDLN
jgi:hypothetical protein